MSFSKRLILGFFLVLGAFSFGNTAEATSGACSYHGGVDCAAGPGLIGQVICNDGWAGSSVAYDSMVECLDQEVVTPISTCTLQSEVSGWQSLCDQEQSVATKECSQEMAAASAEGMLYSMPGNCGEGATTPEACVEATLCQDEVNAYNAEIQAYNQVITTEQNIEENTACQNADINSSYDPTTQMCVCNIGYSKFQGDICLTPEESCLAGLGPDATYGQDGCNCEQGYEDVSGTCTLDPVKNISQQAFQDAKSGICMSDPSLSPNDVATCQDYEEHSNNYTWQIVSPPPPVITPSPAPTSVPTTVATTSQISVPSIFSVEHVLVPKKTTIPKTHPTIATTPSPMVTSSSTTKQSVDQQSSYLGRLWEDIKKFFGI